MGVNINIEIIPHDQHRYETVGDWWFDEKGVLQIRVSKLGDNWKAESAIVVHELCEVLLCKARGISQESVDAFDKQYEAKRPDGDESEPGDDPQAPYRNEHCFATGIERMLIAAFGMSWKDYEDEINSL